TPQVPEARKRTVHIDDQYVVLIGGFSDIDSARRALEKVKKLETTPLKSSDGKNATFVMYELKEKDKLRSSKWNPFTTSFVTRNPTIPYEKPDPTKPDPAWKELNSEETYSLLKAKGAWTLLIKQYQGLNVVAPQSASSSFLEKLGIGGES